MNKIYYVSFGSHTITPTIEADSKFQTKRPPTRSLGPNRVKLIHLPLGCFAVCNHRTMGVSAEPLRRKGLIPGLSSGRDRGTATSLPNVQSACALLPPLPETRNYVSHDNTSPVGSSRSGDIRIKPSDRVDFARLKSTSDQHPLEQVCCALVCVCT